jgi:hypothetical protein
VGNNVNFGPENYEFDAFFKNWWKLISQISQKYLNYQISPKGSGR